MSSEKGATCHQENVDDVYTSSPRTDWAIMPDHAAVGKNFGRGEDELPSGYFRSKFFVGTMAAIGLGLCAGVAAFGYAAPILGIVNADIGPVSVFLHFSDTTQLTRRRIRT